MRWCVLLVASLLFAAPAHASVRDTPDADPPVTDGAVRAVVRDGTTLYLGGDFQYVGPRTSLARLGADGRSTGTFPRVTAGSVHALLDDGAGGWFVGGSFRTIGGADVPRLAHVLADGSVDPAFRPAPSDAVRALALAGGTLYAGGSFHAPRRHLLVLDPATGAVDASAPEPDGTVRALATSGGTVLLGGSFDAVAGQPRRHAAALDATTLALTDWNPDTDGSVYAIAAAGADVYLGGRFGHVGGVARAHLAAVTADSGLATVWDPGADGRVRALAVDAGHVYAAGDFWILGGGLQRGYGRLDRATGAAVDLGTPLARDARALTLSGGRLYVAGERILAIDLSGGLAAWSAPYVGGSVHALAVRGGDVYAGGTFASAGGDPRAHLAAVDLRTGDPTGWDPGADAPVRALALHDGRLFAGGAFTQVAGAARDRLAAFDAGSGALTAFDGRADGTVDELVAGDDGVFAAGAFTTAGGQPRAGLAALDPATGDALAGWDPAPDGAVRALALQDGTLYIGGSFTTIAGAARSRLAAVDAGTGAATAFAPQLHNDYGAPAVTALAAGGHGSVFVAGEFDKVGGQYHVNAAELDGATGAARDWFAGWWTPTAGALAVHGNRVYLGTSRVREYDRATGDLKGTAYTDGRIRDLDASPGGLIAAGEFTEAGWTAARNLATWSPVPALLASPRITGTVADGETLQCTAGTWAGEPTGFDFAWLRDGTTVASGDHYVFTAADAGAELRCRVTARTRGGSAEALSSPAGGAEPPTALQGPSISGTAAYEQTVTCDPGTWSGTPTFAYRWLRDGSAIGGAQAAAYTLTQADAGSELSCRVVAANDGGIGTADAPATVIPDAPLSRPAPEITGTRGPGETLTCSTGAWDGSPTGYTWRWTNHRGEVLGTTDTLVLRDEDAGTMVSCDVRARNAGGVEHAYAWTWIPLPPPVNTVPPQVVGTPQPGMTLTCSTGTWTGAYWLVSIRWLRDGVPVASGRYWRPAAADVGHAVGCEVTKSNGRQTSARSPAVTIVPAPATTPPAPETPARTTPPVLTPPRTTPAVVRISIPRSAVVRRGRATVAVVRCPVGRTACLGAVIVGRHSRSVSVRSGRSARIRVRVRRPRRTARVLVHVSVDGRDTRRLLTLRRR